MLPVPLYCATCGYGHSGRVRSTLPAVLCDAMMLVRRLAVLHPLVERADLVEHVRTFAAAAVPHARRHEQPDAVRGLSGPERLLHAVEVLDRVVGRDVLIAPAVIHQQLAAVREELLAMSGSVAFMMRFSGRSKRVDVLVEVERLPVPVGILENDVSSTGREIGAYGSGPAAHHRPAEFAAGRQRPEQLLAGARIACPGE